MAAGRHCQLKSLEKFGPFARPKSLSGYGVSDGSSMFSSAGSKWLSGSELSSVSPMSSFACTSEDDGTILTNGTVGSSELNEKIKEDGLDDEEAEEYFRNLPTLLRRRYHTFEHCVSKKSLSEGMMRRTLSAFHVGHSTDQVVLSADNQSACHQDVNDGDASHAVVYGNKPLLAVGGTFTFEVEVTALRESMDDYGLAIGFTTTNPADTEGNQDPYQIPNSCSVGYDGRSYQNGVPQRHDFHPGPLKIGDRVRIRVSDDRLIVSLNCQDVGKPVQLQRNLSGNATIWGFVGLIGSALAVRLIHDSSVLKGADDRDGMSLLNRFWDACCWRL
jgi:hypothetical protein